ncbi:MAG: membrane protein insertase YidC [Bacteroidota bacterium]
MDRNTITGLLLIFIILIGYSIWQQPSEEELLRQQQIRDSLAQVQQENERQQREQEQQAEETKTDTRETSEPEKTEERSYTEQDLGPFTPATKGEEEDFYFETDLLKVQLTNKGGRIAKVELKDYQTYDSLPLVLFTKDSSQFNFAFFSENRTVNTDQLYFEPHLPGEGKTDQKKFNINANDSLAFSFRVYPDNQRENFIEYNYVFYGNNHMIDFDVRFVGMDKYIARNVSYINLDWNAKLNRHDKQLRNIGNGATVYYKYFNDDVENLSETNEEDDESLNTKLKWVAFKQRFFSSVLISDNAFDNAEVRTVDEHADREEENGRYLRTMSAQFGVPYEPGEVYEIPMQFYFGPNKYNILRKYELDLEDLIPLGWGILSWINRFAVIPVFNYLEGFNINYGIIILILTILLKLVLFPIAYKTYSSQAKMRALKPEIEELGKKYPKKEDAMKKQQATMSLYKKAGVNPAAGCVPMLLQLPILIAMFRFFPASIELRQESFLWATDLSSYDSIVNLPFTIPFYGDHVSLFTLLMTISTIFYTKLNSEMMGSSSQQMPGMKTMMYIMPVMLLFFLNNYAAALSYYYLLANLITFGQMYLIKRSIDEDKIRKQIAMNKKKPVKKSKWQERMEKMAREQQKAKKRK